MLMYHQMIESMMQCFVFWILKNVNGGGRLSMLGVVASRL